MGVFTKALFGRDSLPKKVFLRGGAYFPDRTKQVLDLFDEYEPIAGTWIPYCYAKYKEQEILLIFNVYGASITLELIQLLRDGGVSQLVFIGSMYAKHDQVGQHVLVTDVYDRAGIVPYDRGNDHVYQREEALELQRDLYHKHGIDYVERTITSVPCVLHSIDAISKYVAESDHIAGVEMELSTYLHFSQKYDFGAFAFIYVSDTPQHPLPVSDAQIAAIREKASKLSSELALELILSL